MSTPQTIQSNVDPRSGPHRWIRSFSYMSPSTYMTSTSFDLLPVSELSVEGDPLTDRVRAVWSSGDFGRIAKGYERGACEFIARLGFDASDRVLDVACGTGNLALPAARTGATVTGIDIAPNL